jgi:hypothetical protein
LNLPQIPSWPLAIAAKAAGAQKGGPPCPKGLPQIGRDHAKIAPPVQRRESQKSSIFRTIPQESARMSGSVLETTPKSPNRSGRLRQSIEGDPPSSINQRPRRLRPAAGE